MEDSTESSGTGDEWYRRRAGIKERKRKNEEEMEKYFKEQDIRSLRDEFGSASLSESEDLEEYGRLLKEKDEWYRGLEKEVQEDVELEDEVIVGSDGQVLREPEVLEEVKVEEIWFDAVVELEDVMCGKKMGIVKEEVEQEEEEEEEDWKPQEEDEDEEVMIKDMVVVKEDVEEEGRRKGTLWSLEKEQEKE